MLFTTVHDKVKKESGYLLRGILLIIIYVSAVLVIKLKRH